MRTASLVAWILPGSIALLSVRAHGQEPVTRTRFELPSSNGHGAIIVSLAEGARRVTQFREHPYSAEEFELDADGSEIWDGGGFAAVHTRDVLFDAYFGVRGPAGSTWLTDATIDLDASGYLSPDDDETRGGTGIIAMVQRTGDLEATSYVFAPFDLPHAGFVMLLRVRNDGNATANDVQCFSLHNLHLGTGRPSSAWDVGQDIGANNETLEHVMDGGEAYFHERGFAGVVVARALGAIEHFGTTPGANPYAQVQAGGDLSDNQPNGTTDAASAWQFDLGDLAPGQEAWAGVVISHWGDPFAAATVQSWLDDWAADRTPAEILADERALWAEFHAGLSLPGGTDAYEAEVLRHAAAMLRMGQVRETEVYLRQWLDTDGVVRRTRLPSLDAPASLPGVVAHRGHGAVLASLPPGNWTYAWIRDGAYAVSAMATLGMHDEARDGLAFYLGAESGRFADWSELGAYDMPPYLISLVRYLGFGVEETDFNDFGPNLEFDGFGLFLWALRNYAEHTGDVAFVEEHWDAVATLVADPLIALVEPETGLLRPDSSIWETHWNGRERHWTYTNITAARGLCDAAALAEQLGDRERATTYRQAGIALREEIATRLVDSELALASNLEELVAGAGYYDAAVIDAVAMGLFDPQGEIAAATLAGLDAHLLAPAGEVGWSRNDDQNDHGGAEDLSPWGSVYDSVEWVITDLRGAIAFRDAGDAARSDAILQWITAQTLANYGMVAETYDRDDGTYQFNTPMLGFGAGAYALALAHRSGAAIDPACGEFYEGGGGDTTGGETTGGGASDGGTADETGSDAADTSGASASGTVTDASTITDGASDGTTGGTDDGGAAASDGDGGCGCNARSSGTPWWLVVVGVGASRARRRRPAAA
jgi:MYXO-CTERM domain-containing protein